MYEFKVEHNFPLYLYNNVTKLSWLDSTFLHSISISQTNLEVGLVWCSLDRVSDLGQQKRHENSKIVSKLVCKNKFFPTCYYIKRVLKKSR